MKVKTPVDERAIIDELNRNDKSNQKTIGFYCNKYGLTTKEVLSLYGKMLDGRSFSLVTLNAVCHSGCRFSRNQRVFRIILKVTSTQRISVNIHCRCQP